MSDCNILLIDNLIDEATELVHDGKMEMAAMGFREVQDLDYNGRTMKLIVMICEDPSKITIKE